MVVVVRKRHNPRISTTELLEPETGTQTMVPGPRGPGQPVFPRAAVRRRGRRRQPRRTAPVCRVAEATAASRTAATSSALSVRSVARSRSENASDFEPSSIRPPS